MARHPQPRRITLGDREAVALTPEEYERLAASRRQIGGQSARVRVLVQQAKRTERLLHDLETLIGTGADACRGRAQQPGPACADAVPAEGGAGAASAEGGAEAACLRCAVAALLRRHRNAAFGA
ncbi:hypothetical protein ACFY71_29030 [Streptomyces cinerochromogenes]|uniref:hypothetical protein n=1 Tax=Streptomyces cinerochromogenes TaxID=66422 RepID=UPI00367A5365